MEGVWIGLTDSMLEFFNYPAVTEAFVDILVCAVPIWVAVMIGLLIGWSWRPRWAGLVFLGFRSKLRYVWTLPPGLGARRFWLAFTALSAFSLCRGIWFRSRGLSRKLGKSSARELADSAQELAGDARESAAVGDGSISLTQSRSMETITGDSDGQLNSVTDKDLEHLLNLLDGKEGELAWQSMMERSTSNMTYQAWRHEPEVGPTVYRSKTIFEDATPEMVRDFFWDDEFRPKWDPMLVYVKILEECPETGMMIVHWIKKFPFFCSDREYIIGRRIWEGVKTYYCVTKGVPYPSLPRRDKPRRVDLYFSSWVIKPAQSRRGGDSQSSSACEVTLIHYEDMGIPKDVAKLGVRHGMWGTVKKLHTGFRAYQNAQKSEASLSRCALNARVTTKVSFDQESDGCGASSVSGQGEGGELVAVDGKNKVGGSGSVGMDWKWVAVGGAVAVVCGLHTGLIGKAVVVGVGHRIARRRGITRSR